MMGLLNRHFRRRLKKFGRSKDGATAVEFALLGGPFLFALLALFELGIMLLAEYSIAQSVETAGRLIRTGQIQMSLNGHQPTAGYFKNQICSTSGSFIDCNKLYVDVRNFGSFADIAGNLPNPYKNDGSQELSDDITVNASFEPGSAGRIVTVRVYYDWELSVPGLGALIGSVKKLGNVSNGTTTNSRLLTSAATFRNEPFSDGS